MGASDPVHTNNPLFIKRRLTILIVSRLLMSPRLAKKLFTIDREDTPLIHNTIYKFEPTALLGMNRPTRLNAIHFS